jgi:hypothetical protein
MFRSVLLVCSASALCLVSAVLAQPEPTRGIRRPISLLSMVYDYIGQEPLTEELKLTPEQLKKFEDCRKKVREESLNMPPEELSKIAKLRPEAQLGLLKETLTEAQQKRAMQIMAQKTLRIIQVRRFADQANALPPPTLTRVSVGMLSTYPEMLDVLSLTAEQKKPVEALKSSTRPLPPGGGFPDGGPPESFSSRGLAATKILLTPEQSQALTKFLGPIFTGRLQNPLASRFEEISSLRDRGIGREWRWSGGRDPRTGSYSRFSLLLVKRVQEELKLTDAQIQSVKKIQLQVDSANTEAAKLSRAQAEIKHKEDDRQHDAATNQLLDPAQSTRLDQILRWYLLGAPEHEESTYRLPMVIELIGITAEQTKALDAASESYSKASVKAFQDGGTLEAIKAKVLEAKQAQSASLDRIITAKQRTQLQESFGKPIRTTGDSSGMSVEMLEMMNKDARARFGRYNTELTTIAREGFVAELKLTAEQKEKLSKANLEARQKFLTFPFNADRTEQQVEQAVKERSEFIEQTLQSILTNEQQKRFAELMIQSREAQRSTRLSIAGSNTTVALPGVAKAIELTSEQKTKILEGKSPTEVLTAEQKAKLTKLAGEPAKADLMALPFDRGASTTPMANRFKIQVMDSGYFGQELKLTQSQEFALAKVLDTMDKSQATMRAKGPRGSTDENVKVLNELYITADREISQILSPEQLKRMSQLELQQQVEGSLNAALRSTSTVEKLKITPEQITAMKELTELQNAKNSLSRELFSFVGNPFRSPPGSRMTGRADPSEATYSQVSNLLEQQTREKLLAILTEPQKALWKELLGEPSKVPLRMIRFTGGFSE